MNFKRHRPKSSRAGCSCGRKALKIAGAPTLGEIRQTDAARQPTRRRKKCAHERTTWVIPTGGMWAHGGDSRIKECEKCKKHLDYCFPRRSWLGKECRCGFHVVQTGAVVS